MKRVEKLKAKKGAEELDVAISNAENSYQSPDTAMATASARAAKDDAGYEGGEGSGTGVSSNQKQEVRMKSSLK